MQSSNGMASAFARPGKAVIGLMAAITAIWLMFAVGLNWGGAPASVFSLFAGDTKAILHGEVWRLLTAPLLHTPSLSIRHLIFALLGLYFFGPRLEAQWGAARFLRFTALSGVVAYALQMLVEVLLPAQLGGRLVGPLWYGLDPAITAMAIAWACTFRGEVVNLFILGPVASRTLILLIVGVSFLRMAAAENPEEGLLSPFFGMLMGWLIGGGSPSPLRKWWLKLRLAQLEGRQANGAKGPGGPRKARPNPGGLRVIPGGRTDDDDDDKGPDGRWLN